MSAGPVAVVGGGAWGTALANAAASAAPREVVLWLRDAQAARAMAERRENARYLPGVPLHPGVRPTAEAASLRAAGSVLVVTPAQTLRGVLSDLAPWLAPAAPLILCAKGIERGTDAFLTEVAAAILPGATLAVLSGPSFAADVARGLPTAVTLATPEAARGAQLAAALSGPSFRVYHGTDMRGVEIGGAAKNVLAIACGAVIGRGLGESARAALVARSFAELRRFARAFGARPETLMGLSGLGDLVLTAASPQSRNFAFGERLGRGASPDQAAGGKLAEGALTAPALVGLARRRGVEMPVAEAVAGVVAGTLSLDEAITGLLSRPLRAEEEPV
ncbi:Glycerol-3-phosphate dehydrogenase (NAD(P)(+)) [Methylobacterium sp. 4-46]|uniref:NAD(P)H-dependent glycerol-3-phosphate dehydrogenase n=1 Tax=unclassified Methylobacterium TaxID=2615210 RepID=UPI000152E7A2|nr:MULTISPECIES: NAD(P)H-dependent glycerol-3-phosphate dehydrogenase [Methylobacterium]ACA18872.1 Glycerol-3-phosphate dehydrogenase (NAD(P)(+)) [Methylobacterium sp. 4-46]WFT78097.1 NAD(P)-dependent glycerol-3-phosphate dehydrogenase [Methylobacterium nodulans]